MVSSRGRQPANIAAAEHGFPDGARTTPVPDLFFSRDLAALEDPVAMKLALIVLWRIHRRTPGTPPAVRAGDLGGDATVVRGLHALGVAADAQPAALRAAVARLKVEGILLAVDVARVDRAGDEVWLLVNDTAGRAAHARLLAGSLVLPDLPPVNGSIEAGEMPPRVVSDRERPNIFALYEEHIGLVTPMLAETLQEAAETYPAEWIEDAFRLAVEANVRKWTYVRAILERWVSEGRSDESHRRDSGTGRERDIEGPYAKYVEH